MMNVDLEEPLGRHDCGIGKIDSQIPVQIGKVVDVDYRDKEVILRLADPVSIM